MKLRKDIVIELLEEGYAIYVPEDDKLVVLNITASFILELIKEGKEVQSIVEEYAQAFSLDRERAYKDVHETLNRLRKEGILED